MAVNGATNGDFAVVQVNGYDFTDQLSNIDQVEAYGANNIPYQNIGRDEYNVGPYKPSLTIDGLRKTGPTSLHTQLAQNVGGGQVGSTTDPAYIISAQYGFNTPPAVGDIVGLFDGTCMDYNDTIGVQEWYQFKSNFKPRGLRGGFGNLIMLQTASTTGTLTSAVFDRGAWAAAGTSLGGVFHIQCTTPSGVQATGTITFTTNAADADTVIINGVTYIFKTAITLANHILIGATSAATALNLYQALIGSVTGKGVAYFAGTTVLPSTMFVTKPTSNVLTITATAAGVAGNAYTLSRTGTNITVGATLTGGLAGDSYALALLSATTSGGSYTAHGSPVGTLQTVGAERIEIPVGTLINRFIKFTATTGGSTSKPAFSVGFRAFAQL